MTDKFEEWIAKSERVYNEIVPIYLEQQRKIIEDREKNFQGNYTLSSLMEDKKYILHQN